MVPLSVLIRRVVLLLPVLLGISTIVFFLQRMIPGNPADFVLGVDAAANVKMDWLARYGLNRPLHEQYFSFLRGLIFLDFGRTYASYEPVFQMIIPRLGHTAMLATSAFSFSIFLALASGLLAAAFAGRLVDKLSAVLSLLAISAPTFIIGPVLVWVFAVRLDWFPLLGSSGIKAFVLPSITLGAALAAFSSRMIRSGLVDVLGEDYIRTARAKGLSPGVILVKHALRNAFLPALTVLGMQLGVLMSGAVITEQIFNWPGLGTLTIEAVSQREYNLLSGCVIVMAVIYVLANLLVDILYRVFDPRVRFQ